jgi:hypothetical protein
MVGGGSRLCRAIDQEGTGPADSAMEPKVGEHDA